MILKINQMYKTAKGYIVPRSHFGSDLTEDTSLKNSKQYAIIDVLIGGFDRFTKKSVTMSRAEIRQALELNAKEKIDIL